MPNNKSAEKRMQIAERNRERNVSIRTSVKTAIKKVLEAIKTNDDNVIKGTLNKAYSIIDKAVTKGVLHKNTAARKKSRITRYAITKELSSK